jgi:radical SAM protein with 4Fe4S-binding SPASM domain
MSSRAWVARLPAKVAELTDRRLRRHPRAARFAVRIRKGILGLVRPALRRRGLAGRPFDGRVPAPGFASIETTLYCNLQCRMCIQYHDGTTVTGPHMRPETFETVARSVLPFVDRWQPSVAGEPLMSKGLSRMLEMASALGVKADMVTNATLLNDRMIDQLLPNLGTVVFSFDGADAETFEYIRAGARFDQVVANIEKLVGRSRRELPEDRWPSFGLGCTLMERNVRGLPALVELAAERLRLDFVSAFHLVPAVPEMKLQSLVHHQQLARECIDRAFEKAKECGIALVVQPLDEVTAASALSPGEDRPFSSRDGHVAGLGYREINQERRRPAPTLSTADPRYADIVARRAEAGVGTSFPPKRRRDPFAPKRAPIWFCDFLWNKTYVAVDGSVRPCCVYGVPVVGNVQREAFDELWNGENYRALRQRMVARNPIPACRGCAHIREITDSIEIDRILQGSDAPNAADLPEIPAALDPTRGAAERPAEMPEPRPSARTRRTSPPRLEWAALPEASGYVMEFSVDEFRTVAFSTAWHGDAVSSNWYVPPESGWRSAPADRIIGWRAMAAVGDQLVEAAHGTIPPES